MNIGNAKPQVAAIDRVMEAIEKYVNKRVEYHEYCKSPVLTPLDLIWGDRLQQSADELRSALRSYVEYEK